MLLFEQPNFGLLFIAPNILKNNNRRHEEGIRLEAIVKI